MTHDPVVCKELSVGPILAVQFDKAWLHRALPSDRQRGWSGQLPGGRIFLDFPPRTAKQAWQVIGHSMPRELEDGQSSDVCIPVQ